MTRRRKPKCGLSGSATEHAAEFQNARHEALEAAQDAMAAMAKQKCVIAGKRIDDGYVAVGKMQVAAQTEQELLEASRVHRALEKADQPFEQKCVREYPLQGLAGLSGTLVSPTQIEFDHVGASVHEDFSNWADSSITIHPVFSESGVLSVWGEVRGKWFGGTMRTESARVRLAARDRLVVELGGPSARHHHANFMWLRLSPSDANALSVWLDALETQGLGASLAGLGAAAPAEPATAPNIALILSAAYDGNRTGLALKAYPGRHNSSYEYEPSLSLPGGAVGQVPAVLPPFDPSTVEGNKKVAEAEYKKKRAVQIQELHHAVREFARAGAAREGWNFSGSLEWVADFTSMGRTFRVYAHRAAVGCTDCWATGSEVIPPSKPAGVRVVLPVGATLRAMGMDHPTVLAVADALVARAMGREPGTTAQSKVFTSRETILERGAKLVEDTPMHIPEEEGRDAPAESEPLPEYADDAEDYAEDRETEEELQRYKDLTEEEREEARAARRQALELWRQPELSKEEVEERRRQADWAQPRGTRTRQVPNTPPKQRAVELLSAFSREATLAAKNAAERLFLVEVEPSDPTKVRNAVEYDAAKLARKVLEAPKKLRSREGDWTLFWKSPESGYVLYVLEGASPGVLYNSLARVKPTSRAQVSGVLAGLGILPEELGPGPVVQRVNQPAPMAMRVRPTVRKAAVEPAPAEPAPVKAEPVVAKAEPAAPAPVLEPTARERETIEVSPRMKRKAMPSDTKVYPSELERHFVAETQGPGFVERLYSVPRLTSEATEVDKRLKAQVVLAQMPATLTFEQPEVNGVKPLQTFVRGELRTMPLTGEWVVSYRHMSSALFTPHHPTNEQRAENDEFIFSLLSRHLKPDSVPAFTEPWGAQASTGLKLDPVGVTVSTGAPVTRFFMRHGTRKPNVQVELTAGRGWRFDFPIERLREDKFLRTGVLELKTDEGRPLTVTFDRRNGDLLQAWLAKSANSGLGELGEAIPAQIEAAAEDFSYFELGTHTAVFDTPLRVTFSVGGPNHVVFIDVAARDSRTQLHRRGAFKVLGTFEPEFRQRGTARGLSEQRYSDPAHLSFQLTPTALARLQVWLDAQEERGALFGLGPAYPAGLGGLGALPLFRVTAAGHSFPAATRFTSSNPPMSSDRIDHAQWRRVERNGKAFNALTVITLDNFPFVSERAFRNWAGRQPLVLEGPAVGSPLTYYLMPAAREDALVALDAFIGEEAQSDLGGLGETAVTRLGNGDLALFDVMARFGYRSERDQRFARNLLYIKRGVLSKRVTQYMDPDGAPTGASSYVNGAFYLPDGKQLGSSRHPFRLMKRRQVPGGIELSFHAEDPHDDVTTLRFIVKASPELAVWFDALEELGPVYPSMQGLQGLGEVNEAARSWANTLLKHGVPPADWLFASMRGAPTKGFEHLPFVYISGYRPVPVGWADKFPPDTVVQVSMEGTRGVIRAASPLDPAVIARLELTPVRAGSIGAFFWATLSNGRALELSKDYGERARLIFKNPRGIWQSSEFVVDVGPTGHTEAPRPEELVWDAFAAGYRDANTGAVDAIMEGAQ